MTDISSQTLHIVAKELAATLNDARASLEAYAERSDQRVLLEKCADQLHSAHGVLRLVEVYGAALLAEEMEHVTRYLLSSDNDQKRQVDGLDALMRAMVQLPTYLERVLSGGRDLALVLLPLLNDLRSVRGSPAVVRGHAAAAESEIRSAGTAAIAAAGRAGDHGGAVGQTPAAAIPNRTIGVHPRRAHGAESGDSVEGGREARAGRDHPAGIPAVVGRRRHSGGAARQWLGGQCDAQAPARPGGPADQGALRTRRRALLRGPAGRSLEQPVVLRRSSIEFRRPHCRGTRLVQALGASAGRRLDRTRARKPVGAQREADAHGGRRHQGGSLQGQGCARYIRAPRRRPQRGTRAAARVAEEDQRHAGSVGSWGVAAACPGRDCRASLPSSATARHRPRSP